MNTQRLVDSIQPRIVDNALFMAGASIAIGHQAWQRRRIAAKAKRLCWAIGVVLLEFFF